MIIREWRARTDPANAEDYPAFFRTAVLPALRLIPGFLGADLARRRRDDNIEFLVLTRWESLASVKGFAGADIVKAVVEPRAAATLQDFDSHVQHYEVLAEERHTAEGA